MLIGLGGSMLFDSLEIGLKEDCPYGDITTELLGISGEGHFRFISRVDGVVSGTERLCEYFIAKKLTVGTYLSAGAKMKKGDVIIEAAGDIKTLFALWRICQTYLTVLCAIAAETEKVVAAARKHNPDIQIVVSTRKSHLGMRIDEMQAVMDGGAIYHRNSLSDTLMVTQNHLRILGEFSTKPYSMQHKIEFEPSNVEEAFRYADKVDVMLLDHFTPPELKEITAKLRQLNPQLQIGVAGGITLADIGDFAGLVDIIVLSSVLYATPLDITCRITRD